MTPDAPVYEFAPDSAPPPGETLKETLELLGIPQADLARRTGLSTKHINQIIQGTAALTPDTALLLERTTGVQASMWNALEAAWRTYLARIAEDDELAKRLDWLDRFPLADLVRRGILPDKVKSVSNLRSLLDFFGVASPAVAEEVWRGYRTAFRRSTVLDADEYASAAWLRLAERSARQVQTSPYDRAKLVELVPQLRALTVESDSVWVPELRRLCSSVGVAVVLVAPFTNAHISGATRWLTPDKVMVALSDRFKRDDQFWFSLFHELGHVLLHGKRLTFMDNGDRQAGQKVRDDPSEQEANQFAVDSLIPAAYFSDYKRLAAFYKQRFGKAVLFDRIEAFARTIGVAPGIVVGILQHGEALPWSHGNGLKKPVDITRLRSELTDEAVG